MRASMFFIFSGIIFGSSNVGDASYLIIFSFTIAFRCFNCGINFMTIYQVTYKMCELQLQLDYLSRIFVVDFFGFSWFVLLPVKTL